MRRRTSRGLLASALLTAALLIALLGCCCPSIPVVLVPDVATMTQADLETPAAPVSSERSDG